MYRSKSYFEVLFHRMSLIFQHQEQLQSPPPPAVYVEAYRPHGGSIGPVIAVLVVIMVLGIIAGIVGRLCSGRTVMGYGHYDLEGWFERKCASCIDGRLEAPPPPLPRPSETGVAAPPAAEVATNVPKQAERRPETPADAAEA